MIRDDLSANLIHLTKGETDAQAANAFLSIFSSKKLNGSSIGIRGKHQCVCFSETPIAKLATILAMPEHNEMRYKPFGVMASKRWIFGKGGRPAIYQTNDEFDLLHASQKFRHVQYDPSITDYTWEREWRLEAEFLDLEPDEVTLVVPTRAWVKWAVAAHEKANRPINIALQGLAPHRPFNWNFVVLEDIGVRISAASPPP